MFSIEEKIGSISILNEAENRQNLFNKKNISAVLNFVLSNINLEKEYRLKLNIKDAQGNIVESLAYRVNPKEARVSAKDIISNHVMLIGYIIPLNELEFDFENGDSAYELEVVLLDLDSIELDTSSTYIFFENSEEE